MSKLSQSQKIVELLKANPNQKFNARQIAEKIVEAYPEDYSEKRLNPRFEDENAFLSQVVAEIGSRKDQIVKSDKHVFWQDKPRPRVYWYDSEKEVGDISQTIIENDDSDDAPSLTEQSFSEHELYPILIEYLKSELKLYCQRIDEKRSKNSRGSGGNQWLHPDIVAMQPVDKEWHELIRSCVKQGAGQSVRLWSFEVKKNYQAQTQEKAFSKLLVILAGQTKGIWLQHQYLIQA